MRIPGIRISRMVLFMGAVLVLTACLSGVSNLAQDDRVTIQTESPRKVSLSVSGVYQRGGFVEVSGRVWRHRLSPTGIYSGHVDVEVVVPDGTISTTTGVPTYPRFIRRGLRHTARFSAQVEAQVQQGTVIRLEFHRGSHNGLV